MSALSNLVQLPEGRDELSAGEEAVEEVNALLPDDLRVFSCSKVTGSFRPRDAVSYRCVVMEQRRSGVWAAGRADCLESSRWYRHIRHSSRASRPCNA